MSSLNLTYARRFESRTGCIAVASPGPLLQEAVADSESNDEKRKARYQANSKDVQAYYRVNRYPAK